MSNVIKVKCFIGIKIIASQMPFVLQGQTIIHPPSKPGFFELLCLYGFCTLEAYLYYQFVLTVINFGFGIISLS